MSVRERKWLTSKGEDRSAWVVSYTDGEGKRRLKTFDKKKDAVAFEAKAKVEVQKGTHIADSASVTVREAGQKWIETAERGTSLKEPLERATVEQYQQHLSFHIYPFIGDLRLSQINVPTVRAFEDRLLEEERSRSMIGKVVRSLGSLLADAQERGLAAHNAVRELSRKRGSKSSDREKEPLEIGRDIPDNNEVRAILHAATGRWRPLIITAIFTGLRASELRGLVWEHVDLDKRLIRVRQRADKYNKIGLPKSRAGRREVPLPPLALNTLREWKMQCPRGDLDLVFPNGSGNIENHGNILNRGLMPTMVVAGVVNNEGKAKYTGMHALRHFYASWCINREVDGGIGLPPKVVQERMGHSSITMTMDVYGHLFKNEDDGEELARGEAALLAVN